MGLMDDIKQKARMGKKRVVLPEGTEERTIHAAQIITQQQIADVTLIGSRDEIMARADGVDLTA